MLHGATLLARHDSKALLDDARLMQEDWPYGGGRDRVQNRIYILLYVLKLH